MQALNIRLMEFSNLTLILFTLLIFGLILIIFAIMPFTCNYLLVIIIFDFLFKLGTCITPMFSLKN